MSKPRPDRGDLIFSPEGGHVPRPDQSGKGKPAKRGGKRRRSDDRPADPQDGVVRVSRERRRGKGVTLITGVPLSGRELAALGKALKQRCGCGGTTKTGVIEIQGDHRDVLVTELEARGWTVKRVGG
jgi:translation initiation factor 1